MGIKRFKPLTGGLRFAALPDYKEITKSTPEKSLLEPKRKSGGRNCHGRVTVRFRGGGHKQMYRIIDFKRSHDDKPATVLAIEYDPNRSARLALLEYADKTRTYILAPLELKVGDKVMSTITGEIEMRVGNCMPIKRVPLGTAVHNIELVPGKGAQMVRSAGGSAQLMAKEGGLAQFRLPSGEMRKVSLDCRCTLGQLGNVEHETVRLGKAGRKCWLGFRPNVRGAAMNAVDHPHGGGEGKAPQGNPHPVSPWGMKTKGLKTRRSRKYSSQFIMKRRAK